ncbi:MAG: succinylglutamate desuccinylase/aspartoacylase family protein [Candidatus Marinimicrobia bacterium]|nr:succinylglutamate desuccinylase/aspartoacylase family protein [Candidatus Neomarinimicrobiota bacterium]MCF7921840.1 succinylglutamate desuccinylase/aspartoacylase family protein [Candidatus Neomarinimicrobiota bacterium]
MNEPLQRKSIDMWFGHKILPGESRNVTLTVGESYSSMDVQIPIHVRRSKKEGPVVFVTAALHGDEINGTGAVRQLIQDDEFQLKCGTLILIPVLNLLAFDRHSRYLPDRRDLNRSFPGTTGGSLASRMARILFDEIVAISDFGIDLHTASIRRTNYPNVRGDLSNPMVRKLAKSFGSEIILNGVGPVGGFRREASKAGCPTIIMEGGEVWKVEPTIVETAVRGVKNVLRKLGMLEGTPEMPKYQLIIEKSKWIRADFGGFMQFHVSPGDIVDQGQPLATNTTLLGDDQNTLVAPFDAVVIGMTTLPAISPGEPICNLGKLPTGAKPRELRRLRETADGLEQRVIEDLASNMIVVEPDDN